MLPTLWRLEIAKVCAELKPRALISVGGFAGEIPIESLCEIAATTLSVRFVIGFGSSSLRDSVTSLDEAPQALQSGAASPKARNLHGPALITFTTRAGVPCSRCSARGRAAGARRDDGVGAFAYPP